MTYLPRAPSFSSADRKTAARSATWTVAQCWPPAPSMIKLPSASRGEPSRIPGMPPPPSPYAVPDMIKIPRIPGSPRMR